MCDIFLIASLKFLIASLNFLIALTGLASWKQKQYLRFGQLLPMIMMKNKVG